MPTSFLHRGLLMLHAAVAVSSFAGARSADSEFIHDYNNLITIIIPTYYLVGKFSVFGYGLGYERFLGGKNKFSAVLGFYKCGGGVNKIDKLIKDEVLTNTQILLAQPALFWHPDGNRSGLSFGVSLPIGTLHRRDYRGNGNSYYNADLIVDETPLMTGLLGHINVTIYSRSNFVTVISLGAGAILSAGSTNGSLVDIGLAFGGAF